MSIAAITLAWRAPLDTAQKLALIALCDHADEKGACWPSMGRIAAMLNRTRSQAQRLVHALIADGWVQVTGNASGGRGCTRRYRIALDRLAALPDPTDPERIPDAERVARMRRFPDAERVASTHEKGRMDAQKGRMYVAKGPHGCDPNRKESSEPSLEPLARTRERATPDAIQTPQEDAPMPERRAAATLPTLPRPAVPQAPAAPRAAGKRGALAAPTPEHEALAGSLGLSVALEWVKYRDWQAATGKRHRDEHAGFRIWLRKAQQFAARTSARVPARGRHAARNDFAAEIFGQESEDVERDITAEATRVR